MTTTTTTQKSTSKSRRPLMIFAIIAMLAATMFSVNVAAPEASAGGTCIGEPQGSLSYARIAYSLKCGQTWNYKSGNHKCDWTSRGWSCSGPSTGTSCQGDYYYNFSLKQAKDSFRKICGRNWNGNSGHDRCAYRGDINAWRCTTNRR